MYGLQVNGSDRLRLWLFRVLGGRKARGEIYELVDALNRVWKHCNSKQETHYILLPKDMVMLREALKQIKFLTLESIGMSQQKIKEIEEKSSAAQRKLGIKESH